MFPFFMQKSFFNQRQFSPWRNHHEPLSDKPTPRTIIQIIKNWLTLIHDGPRNAKNVQRPDRISGPPLSTFKLSRGIEISYVGRRIESLLFCTHGPWVVELFAETNFSLIASTGFFPVNRVFSPFRAKTTFGRLFTHSLDLSADRKFISWLYW